MNEFGRDLDPWYIPTKFSRDLRRIAPGRALTGLCLQMDRRTISFQYTPFQLRWTGVYKYVTRCECDQCYLVSAITVANWDNKRRNEM